MTKPGERLYSAIRAIGHGLHMTVSRNRRIAAWYLHWLGKVCRQNSDGQWKQRVLNSLDSVKWPDVQLQSVTTRIPDGKLELTLVPHLGEFDFQVQIYRELQYEPEVFRWLATRSYLTIIEIGANIGVFTVYLAKLFSAASIYAFEPSREAFSRLLTNLKANPCTNVLAFNCAVFTQTGFLHFHEPVGHLTNGSLEKSFASIFSSQVTTVTVPALAGSMLETLVIRPPMLVKLDVEGAEASVLESLRRLIECHRPDLIIEVLPVTESVLNELWFVRDGSYSLYNLQSQGLVKRDRFVASNDHRDYVLLPA